MKKWLLLACLLLGITGLLHGQTNPVLGLFPKGTRLMPNLPYAGDTLSKHRLDLYLPAGLKTRVPLVVFIHGGGWLVNDKYADIGYMKNTVAALLGSGYALASIDYRHSTQAIFPAQIQDCNRAVSYLMEQAGRYGLDTGRLAVMGFSAGGHLASLLGLSGNNHVNAFFMEGTHRAFAIRAVVDFYGPSELLLFPGNDDPRSPESLLLGATALARPDRSAAASPVSYVDGQDPPFLIIHGQKDTTVSLKHSQLLSSWLGLKGVENELIVVENAPHFGEMFDAAPIRARVLAFLGKHLR